jgi:putative transposase
MDGKGRCHDNIFIERLWRTIKYKYLYLHASEGGQDLNEGLRSWVNWCNRHRPHQGLSHRTRDEVSYVGQQDRVLIA